MNLNTEQHFSVVPRADIPRSVFDRSFSHKTTVNVNYLYPIFIDEALPGDSFKLDFTVFGRLLNPLVCPVTDEIYLETLWFKCPIRILWSNWERFCGAQDNPNDSTDYLIPIINSGSSGGFSTGSLADYFGIPTKIEDLDVNALPFRCYNLIYNTWFRDENLINSATVPLGDSDSASNYTLLKSAKMHDYFTSCLPFAQKSIGASSGAVNLPLGSVAPVITQGIDAFNNGTSALRWRKVGSSGPTSTYSGLIGTKVVSGDGIYTNEAAINSSGVTVSSDRLYPSNLFADLRNASSATINDLRFAFQLQKYKERNMRSGTRYTEYISAHFNVSCPDYRLQRPEFLGSSRDMIDINTVVQTGSGSTPNGSLTAYGVIGSSKHGFTTSFTEHSYVIGIARIRHNPIYQQGLNRLWSRQTLFDFYDPLFACIGEQPVLNKEIVAQGNGVTESDGVTIVDDEGFGFQEAWADYRYHPSMITGYLRSNVTNGFDFYHFAQYFADSSGNPKVPVLNQSFIEEDIPIERSIAVSNEPQFILDFSFRYRCARPMPVHSVPGLIDHF